MSAYLGQSSYGHSPSPTTFLDGGRHVIYEKSLYPNAIPPSYTSSHPPLLLLFHVQKMIYKSCYLYTCGVK